MSNDFESECETMRILVVDDEQDIAEILQYNLKTEGYDVDVAFSAEEALPVIKSQHYDLILLDVMMGEVSGFGLARILKKDDATAHIPIIFITALDGEEETLKGFDLGADDYIPKPLSMREVKARVRAVLRRATQAPQPLKGDVEDRHLSYETLKIDMNSMVVTVDNQPVTLTHLELEILIFLLRNKGRVYSRQELIDRLWPEDTIVLERTVDVNITRLRKKIEPYGEHIKTKIGYGYYFS